MPTQIRGKCIVVGDSTVGKSSLCQCFHSDGQHFPKNYSMTTGVELLVKTVNVPETNETVEVFLYDCAGKEVFFDLIQKHWEHPAMVIIAYDVTNELSFSSCVRWVDRIRHIKPAITRPAVLLANKTDLSSRRVVTPKMGEDFAANNNLTYFECSAKESENVDAPFVHLAKEYHALYKDKIEQAKELVSL